MKIMTEVFSRQLLLLGSNVGMVTSVEEVKALRRWGVQTQRTVGGRGFLQVSNRFLFV